MSKSRDKKEEQLGMTTGKANSILNRDILWHLVVKTKQDSCFHCGELMTRETFSVEHKTPWLDSEDPVSLFFNMDNISFSHLACNTKAARQTTKKYHTEEERLEATRRLKRESRKRVKPEIEKARRREQYLKHKK